MRLNLINPGEMVLYDFDILIALIKNNILSTFNNKVTIDPFLDKYLVSFNKF